MKFMEKILTTASKVTGRTGLAVKAASPEILLVVGITGAVVSTVLACRATLKVNDVLEIRDENSEKIKEVWERVESGDVDIDTYSEKDKQKDLAVNQIQTVGRLVKLYAPAVTLGVVSFACIIGGHKIMKTRNVALMAAYQAIEKGFAAYRKRVVEEYGEEKDYMFKNGLRYEQINETITDEKGKKKEISKTKLATDPNGLSMYARFFDDSSKEWEKNPEYNKMFLVKSQSYFNDLLQTRGHVFLNEVYDALGLPRSEAGTIVGWMIGEGRDNFIDFGLYDNKNGKTRDFINGYENSILLDFNVDGIIYNLFTKKKGLTS